MTPVFEILLDTVVFRSEFFVHRHRRLYSISPIRIYMPCFLFRNHRRGFLSSSSHLPWNFAFSIISSRRAAFAVDALAFHDLFFRSSLLSRVVTSSYIEEHIAFYFSECLSFSPLSDLSHFLFRVGSPLSHLSVLHLHKSKNVVFTFEWRKTYYGVVVNWTNTSPQIRI